MNRCRLLLLRRMDELAESRTSAMSRVKIAEKQLAATQGPAAVAKAYIAKKGELAVAVDTQIQTFIRSGQVRMCQLLHCRNR